MRSAVLQLISRDQAEALARDASVEVDDLGDTYSVVIHRDGEPLRRNYHDAARGCQRRARFASVFIVLTLLPPELWPGTLVEGLAEPDVTAPEPAGGSQQSPAPRSPPSTHRLVRVELGSLFETARGSSESPALETLGAELRGVIGNDRVAATLSIGYAPRARIELQALEATLTRVPGSVGVRLQTGTDRVRYAAEVGGAAVLLQARGESPWAPTSDSGIDFGLRAAVQASLSLPAQLFVFAGAQALYFPKPRELAVAPRGSVGELPPLWLGATLGVGIELF